MRFYSMSKEELEIEKMKNITYIAVDDIFLPHSSKNQNSLLHIMVMHDGPILSYCDTDKYFDKFKLKLLNQYKYEKERRNIELCGKAKEFLDLALSGKIEKSPNIFSMVPTYDESIIRTGEKKFKKFENIMKYNLDIILKHLGKDYDISNVKGYRNLLNLGDRLSLDIKSINEKEIVFEIMGLLDNIEIALGKINISTELITFFLKTSQDTLSMHSSFENTDDGILKSVVIESLGELLFIDRYIYDDKLTIEEENSFNNVFRNELSKSKIKNIRKLPWNAYFAGHVEDGENVNHYIEKDDNHILHMFSSTTKYIGDYEYLIHLSEGIGKFEVFRVDDSNTGISELYFFDVPNALGKYKDDLMGKYFYFTSSFDNFENPKSMKLEKIKDTINLEKTLFDESKKLIRR